MFRVLRCWRALLFLVVVMFSASTLYAVATGTVRGLVHDQQHRPVAGARANLRAVTSSLQFEQTTTDEGLFTWTAVPAGEYELTVEAESFATQKLRVVVKSGETPVFHVEMAARLVEQRDGGSNTGDGDRKCESAAHGESSVD